MDDKNLKVEVEIEGTAEAAHGIGKLALFAIPLVIVLAVSGLVGVLIHLMVAPTEVTSIKVKEDHEINQIHREESAQARADNRVGAAQLPTQPMKLVMKSTHPCIKINKGYLDAGEFVGYIQNVCHSTVDYYEVHVNGVAPDGTIVSGRYDNTAILPELAPGDKAEIHCAIAHFGESLDDRIVTVRVTITGND